jgi:hypothetical protein
MLPGARELYHICFWTFQPMLLLPLLMAGTLVSLVALGAAFLLPSSAEEDTGPPSKRWRYIIGAAGLTGIIGCTGAMVHILHSSRPEPFGGGLVIHVDPGVRVYVGDKLVSTGPTFVPWKVVFGWGNEPALAAEGDFAAGSVSADALGGPGAVFVQEQGPSGGQGSSTGAGVLTFETYKEDTLVRRSDDALDLVTCVSGAWNEAGQPKHGFLVPIRVRGIANPAARYCMSSMSASITSSGGPFGSRSCSWTLTLQLPPQPTPAPNLGHLPENIRRAIEEKEFWEPAGPPDGG